MFDLVDMQLCVMTAVLVCYLDDVRLFDMAAVQLYKMGAIPLLEIGDAQFFLDGYCTIV